MNPLADDVLPEQSESPKAVTGGPPAPVVAERAGSEFLQRIPRDFAREHLLISQGRINGVEHMAVAASTDKSAIFNVGVHLGVPLEITIGQGEAVAEAIDLAYSTSLPSDGDDNRGVSSPEPASGSYADDVDALLAAADRDLLSTKGKGPVVKLVDALLFEALSRGASDVHVQPLTDRTLVRFRLDGVLHTARQIGHDGSVTGSNPPDARRLTAAIVSRIKVMGRMDIAERRLPQDGRAAVTIGGRSIDLRISTLPTSYGERAVIRLLDNTNHLCDFQKIGMPEDIAKRYLSCASQASGMILLTGPTGSGKTTTLYSTLRQVGSPAVNIMTIEDPIEYELATVGLAVSQAQVNVRKGVTFATGLRHILRQDPDIVMVGEIRDAETARIAIQASLTGHMVFSTLHTNDAPSAVTRVIDLGIEPYLVSASLSAVLAQRLVRTCHGPCAGRGCTACFDTGFLGRTGLFELMVVDDAIADLISRNEPVQTIRTAAHAGGLRTLGEDGRRLVRAGLTTMREVLRVVQGAWDCEGEAL